MFVIHARVKQSTCSCRIVAPREIQVEDPSSRISRGTVNRSAVKNNIDVQFKTISEYSTFNRNQTLAGRTGIISASVTKITVLGAGKMGITAN